MMNLYSIFDTVAEQYGPIWMAKNHGVAIRNYKRAIQDKKIDPQDEKLHYIGDWDADTGLITQSNDCRYDILSRITTETEEDE